MESEPHEIPCAYRVLDKTTGGWFQIDQPLVAQAYQKLGYKVLALYAKPVTDEIINHAISSIHRQHNQEGDCDLSNEGPL